MRRRDHGHDPGPSIDGLDEHALLAPLLPAERARVAALCEPVELPADTLLLAQGEPALGLYLVLEGHVEVTMRVGDREHAVAVLGPGAVVGELSMLEDEDRSTADVRALTRVRAALVERRHAPDLLAVDAVALQLDAVARRRRATNRALRVPPVEAGSVDGRALRLRPLWPEDWRHLATGGDRVSDESLRMRFFHVPPLTERTFRRLTLTDHTRQFAWGAFVGGLLVGIGRHALQAEDRGTAELAVLVADQMQRKGIATRLVAAIAAAADAHGAVDLHALARAENVAVRGLLERFGAEWHDGEDAGTIAATWPVATALAAIDDHVLLSGAHAAAAAVLGDVLDR